MKWKKNFNYNTYSTHKQIKTVPVILRQNIGIHQDQLLNVKCVASAWCGVLEKGEQNTGQRQKKLSASVARYINGIKLKYSTTRNAVEGELSASTKDLIGRYCEICLGEIPADDLFLSLSGLDDV